MKTRLLLIVGLMMAAVACGQKSVEKKIADYKKWDAEFGEKYQQTIMGIMADSTLTEDAINTKVSEYSDSAFKEYIDYNKNLLSQNKSNALGLEIIKNIYTELEDDELKEALDALDKDVAEGDDFVKSVGASIVAKAATAEGKMFTDFEVDGVKFSDFIGKGKYVLVDFWASWCGPCRGEMPNLRAVYDEFHGDNFDMLSVAVWDKPEDTAEAAAEENITWNQIVNAQRIPTELYGIQGIPHIILFGPDGTILRRNLRGEAIRDAVASYLKK